MTRHNVPQPAFNVLMGVFLRDRLYSGHQVTCHGHGEAETRLRGGWCHVDKRAVGDGFRAGVAEDDLSEKALGAVCFGGFKCSRETDPESLSRLPFGDW